MGLLLHRAERTDLLADGLADLLADPPDDPFAEEVVVVPAKGVERWLTQRLSHRLGVGDRGGDGVCAGVRFLNPSSLVALLTGADHDDPWHPDRLAWPVLEAVDASLDEDWCAPLAHHLGHRHTGVEAELRRQRRWSVARRLAGLFASYAVQRPQLLTDWREGRDSDGAGDALPPDLTWQPELWRRVLQRVPAVPPDLRHADALRHLEEGEGELPDRLSLFGHTRLPRSEVELLRALGASRDVHLWLPQPSPGLWQALAARVADGPVRRRTDPSAESCRHPLLASLGRDTRELQRTLSVLDATPSERSAATSPDSLLGRLQADVRANRPPEAGSAVPDESLQVHACHGTARQVEVLREVLVGLLAADPTLQPRDVLVMCPDIDAYAPLVQAGFGLGERAGAHPAHELNVRLADRGLLHTNPLLATAARLVELVSGRATASEVLDLASSPPVRQRFRFTDDELTKLAGWVARSAIRWGLDRDSREPFHMDAFEENTWAQGVERLLLGVAVPEDGHRVVGSRLPVDDVASGDVDLAGRLAELVARLRHAHGRLTRSGPPSEWITALSEAVASVAAVPPREAWQASQFERELAVLAAESSDTHLTLADVRTLLDQRMSGRPTRANFRTGTLTVCTMVPMRSVPHRVICLLGVDDGVFPRSTTADGDDVLARDPRTGERDARSEDRQLFLDAILAAGEKLVITYSGASEHTGQPRPPSVPLGELLDVVERMTGPEEMGRVHRRHPLQPFAEANFAEPPFSFDVAARRGAEALRDQRPAAPFLDEPLPPVTERDLTLTELVAFFRNPARAILNRLDVSLPRDDEGIKDAMPIDLDGLERWAIGDRMVNAVLAGDDAQAICTAELHRGEIPPGRLGERALTEIATLAQALVTETSRVHTTDPESLEVELDLGGSRLVGTVAGLHGDHHLLRLTYSRLAAKHLLPAWLELLAATASHPDRSLKAHCLGRGRKGVAHAVLGPVTPEEARELLTGLLAVRAEGLSRPWLVPLATGHAWAVASRAGHGNEVAEARRKWETSAFSPVPGEDGDAAFVRILGARAPFAALEGLGTRADALWFPLLDRLTEVSS
ncbi:MAG TPA: exodeoxyribonuclease V subunit gamma [Nocardioides sp.]|nr:exodeoxyribonuclease V subunit gamma [Nocardioides sp.]